MRDIIFRAKTVDDSEWKHGDLITVKRENLCGIKENSVLGLKHLCISETVGEYTGLSDKNGTKIFEGDVIKGVAYSSEWVGTVVWINEIASFGVMYRNRTDPTTIENSSLFKALRIGMNNEYCAEVIGNIYDNPELLAEGAADA